MATVQKKKKSVQPLEIYELKQECLEHIKQLYYESQERTEGLGLLAQYIEQLPDDNPDLQRLARDPRPRDPNYGSLCLPPIEYLQYPDCGYDANMYVVEFLRQIGETMYCGRYKLNGFSEAFKEWVELVMKHTNYQIVDEKGE